MEKYKRANLAAYQMHAQKYAESTADYFVKVPEARAMLGAFAGLLNGRRVLDLGCGPGRDSIKLRKLGVEPVGADISSEMLAIASSQGIAAVQMDFEHLGFKDEVFDGVWAFHSLQHAPKYKLPLVLKDIARILKPGAPFLASFIEGKGNEWRKGTRFPGCKRYFAYYQETELRRLLGNAGFQVVGVLRPEPLWLNMLTVRPSGDDC